MDFLTRPKRSAFQLKESDLMCKNSCGFYGNPEWHGLCSRCFREYQRKADAERAKGGKVMSDSTSVEKTAVHHDHHHHHHRSPTIKDLPSSFDRFVSKKKQQSERKSQTVRSIFAGSTASPKGKCLTGRLIDWSIYWSIDDVIDRSIDWLIDFLFSLLLFYNNGMLFWFLSS